MNGNVLVKEYKKVEDGFGYSYFAHMIPPTLPAHSLFLGYGKGVVADLMRKVHGHGKITAVDLLGYQKVDAYLEHKMVVLDAWEFVKKCTDTPIKTRFDYIAVDLWEGDKVCDFIYRTEFAVRLSEMCKDKVCINQPSDDFERLKAFHEHGFTYDRSVVVYGNRVSWWSVGG